LDKLQKSCQLENLSDLLMIGGLIVTVNACYAKVVASRCLHPLQLDTHDIIILGTN
jgi:hypothetical protein